MSVDVRNFGCRDLYTDKCYYYDNKFIDKNKLAPDAKPLGRFYKRDVEPFQYQRISIGGDFVTQNQYQGVVETIDNIDIKPDMYVVDQNGKLYLVGDNIQKRSKYGNKRYSTRPAMITTFTLIGVE